MSAVFEIEFVERDSPEWTRMWRYIADTFGDAACLDDGTNEVWQHMGTVRSVHRFRHRSLPIAAARWCGIKWSAAWSGSRRVYLDLPVGDYSKATVRT